MSDQGASVEQVGRRFHLVEVIGAGAFGEVYLAEQDSGAGFRRKVAIKLLHQDMERFPEAGRRMRDEARILGRLSHRHIVAVLDLLRLGERWAIVMDYVPGADLEQILRALYEDSADFPVPAALEIGAAVLDALDAAYNADDGRGGILAVIHRDIKPSNIRLTDGGEVKVLDFGVARVNNLDTREAQTRRQGMIGTELYMAPERILSLGDSLQGDVYALAATVVELILREPLGRTPILDDKHQAFVDEALGQVRAMVAGRDGAPDELVAELRRALAPHPEDRPLARELSDVLARLARRVDGEDLRSFSRRYVPQVVNRFDGERRPVGGVLSEASSSALPTAGAGTLLPGDETRTYDGSASSDTSSSGRTRDTRLILGAAGGAAIATLLVVVLGGVTLVALFVFFAQRGGEGGAQVTPADPDRERPVVVEVDPPAPPPPPAPPDGAVVVEPAPPPVPPPEVPAPPPTRKPPTPRETTAAPTPPTEPPPADPNAPRVRRGLVVVKDASSVQVTCGGAVGRGTASASIRDFPAGTCAISATHLGGTYNSTVHLDEDHREVQCAVTDGALTCN